MLIVCSKCGSKNIDKRNYAKRATASIGAVTAGFGSYVTVSGGATAGGLAGARMGAHAGPVGVAAGTTVGAITGAVLGALASGSTGAVIGAKLGELIDEHVLDNFKCCDCSHTFSN